MSKYSEHLIHLPSDMFAQPFSELVSKHNAMAIHLRTLVESGRAATSADWGKSYGWLLKSSLESLEALGFKPGDGPSGGQE